MKTLRLNIYTVGNLALTVLLPAVALLYGHVTVFYLVYLYWWQELIASALDGIYFSVRRSQHPEAAFNPFWPRAFVLGIYFVFIVVLFGLMNSWSNAALLRINVLVFVFRDMFFNVSLAGILVNEWWLRRNDPFIKSSTDPFSGRMIVLHISIILGAAVHFLLSDIVTPENLWRQVWACAPFLLLKTFVGLKQTSAS